MDTKDNQILIKSKEFAIRIINLYKFLQKKNEFILSSQIIRSATSIGANISEGRFAVSKSDFINKLHIALKEASETSYWLDLLFSTNYINESEFKSINDQCEEIIKILSVIIKNSKSKNS